jgi:putative transposase
MMKDRVAWLDVIGNVSARFNWIVHAYCQMTSHYHLIVETVDGNLSKGMRQLNGVYTQRFNRHHSMVGTPVPGALQGSPGPEGYLACWN